MCAYARNPDIRVIQTSFCQKREVRARYKRTGGRREIEGIGSEIWDVEKEMQIWRLQQLHLLAAAENAGIPEGTPSVLITPNWSKQTMSPNMRRVKVIWWVVFMNIFFCRLVLHVVELDATLKCINRKWRYWQMGWQSGFFAVLQFDARNRLHMHSKWFFFRECAIDYYRPQRISFIFNARENKHKIS